MTVKMHKKPLHIISFDNPFPPVYGGTVEVFHKLKPLAELGYEIILHCFVDRVPADATELQKICGKVFFYRNRKNPFFIFSKIPFSVRYRTSELLLQNLLQIDAPILFEGLKTTLLVHQQKLPQTRKILRLHNIESLYFNGLKSSETNWFRRKLFGSESDKYRKYESVLPQFDSVATLSNFENELVKQSGARSVYIPVFHGNQKVQKLGGFGQYAFYHGDLRMADNRRVVRMLIGIFKNIPDYKLVIASGTGRKFTLDLIGNSHNIEYRTIDNFAHLQQMLIDAHINLIFSFQRSGTKLKLLNALYNSRFCMINENIIDDAVVAGLCEFADTESEILKKIQLLRITAFSDFERRSQILEMQMNDKTNAALLAATIDRKWN